MARRKPQPDPDSSPPAAIVPVQEHDPTLRASDKRVLHIIELMRTKQWERGGMAGTLSKLWGLSEGSVNQLACEAGRHLRILDDERLSRDWCMAQLQRIVEQSDQDGVRVAAIKTILDAMAAWGDKTPKEVSFVAPLEQRVQALVDELLDPGPELVEALRRVGVPLPLREVIQ